MLAIVAGAVALSWPSGARFGDAWPALAVLGACLAWAIDNNLTRKVALNDATWIAAVTGLSAGTVNLLLVFSVGSALTSSSALVGGLVLGLAAYGISLALFVVGLRRLGTARTGAYFSVAPFFGALLAVIGWGEPVTPVLLVAGALMALGVWLHLTEHHGHEHAHEPLDHDHEHEHDAHHQHAHADGAGAVRHAHRHRHDALTHTLHISRTNTTGTRTDPRMMEFLRITGLFALTALAEIIGCYLPWLVLTQGRPHWLLLPAAAALAVFAWLLTWHPSAAGRTYAAYGGVYVVVALVWLWRVDGVMPTRWDLIGGAVCLVGMAIIALQPRPALG